jgi:hypothetical protein
MAWLRPSEWYGLSVGVDKLQHLRFEGIDRDTGYICYKTAPANKLLVAGRQMLHMGGEKLVIHIFCSEPAITSAVDAVIHDHPDALLEWKWTLKGPTWFNTSKYVLCTKLRDVIGNFERELGRQHGPSIGGLEVRAVELDGNGTRHCVICLRRAGTDLHPSVYDAIADAQEAFLQLRDRHAWDALSFIVRRCLNSATAQGAAQPAPYAGYPAPYGQKHASAPHIVTMAWS